MSKQPDEVKSRIPPGTIFQACTLEIVAGEAPVGALSTSMAVGGKTIGSAIDAAIEFDDADTADAFTTPPDLSTERRRYD